MQPAIDFDQVKTTGSGKRLDFRVVGTPKAQPRARRSANGGVYNPNGAKLWKFLVLNEARRIAKGKVFEGPTRVTIVFFMPRPNSHFRSNGSLKDDAPHWHTSKPDKDNLEKSTWDALVRAKVIQDDRLICSSKSDKVYAYDEPGARITIEAVD